MCKREIQEAGESSKIEIHKPKIVSLQAIKTRWEIGNREVMMRTTIYLGGVRTLAIRKNGIVSFPTKRIKMDGVFRVTHCFQRKMDQFTGAYSFYLERKNILTVKSFSPLHPLTNQASGINAIKNTQPFLSRHIHTSRIISQHVFIWGSFNAIPTSRSNAQVHSLHFQPARWLAPS